MKCRVPPSTSRLARTALKTPTTRAQQMPIAPTANVSPRTWATASASRPAKQVTIAQAIKRVPAECGFAGPARRTLTTTFHSVCQPTAESIRIAPKDDAPYPATRAAKSPGDSAAASPTVVPATAIAKVATQAEPVGSTSTYVNGDASSRWAATDRTVAAVRAPLSGAGPVQSARSSPSRG